MRSNSVAQQKHINSCFQLRPSLATDCIAFLITRLIRSTFPFAWGYNGVVLLWVIPRTLESLAV